MTSQQLPTRSINAAGHRGRKDPLARYTGFDVPEIGPETTFNPARATPGELRRFGLPPKPDANRQPLLRRVWDGLFDREIRLLQFEPSLELFDAVQYRILRRGLGVLFPVRAQAETSSNWSGAYITANEGRRFLQVCGIWRTPDVLKVPESPPKGKTGIDYVVANWIGLDGQRAYFDSSLPQIGTSSILESDLKTVRVDAWVQWWAVNDPKPKIVPIPMEIHPGDVVGCVLTVSGPHTVDCVITNLNPQRPDTRTVHAKAPNVPREGVLVRPRITGATAEWIVERPTVIDTTTPNNLPDYGETGFELCLAIEGEGTKFSPTGTAVPQNLSGARTIRMYDILPDPARTVFTSMPHKIDDSTLRVRYGGFRPGP